MGFADPLCVELQYLMLAVALDVGSCNKQATIYDCLNESTSELVFMRISSWVRSQGVALALGWSTILLSKEPNQLGYQHAICLLG